VPGNKTTWISALSGIFPQQHSTPEDDSLSLTDDSLAEDSDSLGWDSDGCDSDGCDSLG